MDPETHSAQPADIDPSAFAQVTGLLGDTRARALLLLLETIVFKLHRASDVELLCPDGRSRIHRLKSEAGLMGFARLQDACADIDGLGPQRAPSAEMITDLRLALLSALSAIDRLARIIVCHQDADRTPSRFALAYRE